MNKKLLVKTVLLFLVGCFFVVTQTAPVNAVSKPGENRVIVTGPTTNVGTAHGTHKDNAFELMTKKKEKESTTGLNEAITNTSTTIETFVWSMVKGLGEFNAVMIKTLFSMDIIAAIEQPIMDLAPNIATNMLGITGTIGIALVLVALGVKFIGQRRYKQFFDIFLMTILIFTGLSVLEDANTPNFLSDMMFSVDKEVETAFTSVNPILGDVSISVTEKGKDKDGNEVE